MSSVDSSAGSAPSVDDRYAHNESVDPAEIADMALMQALFLHRYAAATAS